MAALKLKSVSISVVLWLSVIVCIQCRNHHKCAERAIEAREEEANVVFTGTVRDLYPDSQHPGQRKAKVEVKRIMKGNNIIKTLPGVDTADRWRPKMVVVDGIGDPHICESFARKYDTRIFMMNKNGNGELKLNSSLVRLTLNNIKEADAAVKDVPFLPKPTPPRAACDATFCAYGAQCVENANGEAMCECLEVCDDVDEKVCGSDRETYQSECHLRLKSCKEQKRILLIARHDCDVKDPCAEKECAFGAQCVPSFGGIGARCQCLEKCDNFGDSVGSKPVCGSDGRDYPNVCEMRKHACNVMEDITEKYEGKCDPCQSYECPEGKLCQLGPDRSPVCSCNTVCTSELATVCGSDGRTYSNPCLMRVEACKTHKDIKLLFYGDCNSDKNPCNRLKCGLYEECQVDRNGEAVCKCPDNCEPVMRPVCGSDSNTYDNECTLKKEACEKKQSVSVKFNGACSSDGPCAGYRCHHGAVCVVKNGRPMCECPNCSEEFKPVCGTDNQSYANDCKLKVENCEKRRNIQVKYEGPCNGCQNKKCDFYSMCKTDSNGIGQCVCPEVCVEVYTPVCGTDGITYPNECRMKIAACRRQQFVMVASQGDCDLCKNKQCQYGARCDSGKCVCPQRCPDQNSPVCATDGQTYTNECEMKRHSCIKEVDLNVFHMGECDEQQSGSGVEGSGVETCDDLTCKYGGTCDFDLGCVCRFVCPSVRFEVCGSDGKTYGNKCDMELQACRLQMEITPVSVDNCEFESVLCDGNPPLNNPMTNRPYDCENGRDTCPSRSYCHRVNDVSRCCQEELPVLNCGDTKYGCCPDGETLASGPGNAGCPSYCQCNPLGSYETKCDPTTRQCYCKPGIGGLRCDRCDAGYWGMPRTTEDNGCSPCGCHPRGTARDDCEQMTGQCVCQPGIQGMKCDRCPNNVHIDSGDCIRSSIIGEFCSSDTDCVVESSYCKSGMCSCKDNRQPNLDNTVCEADAIYFNDQGEMTYTNPSFAGKSFLQLSRFTNGHTKLTIEMVFESSNYNGILLYAGQMTDGRGDFVSLALRDGFVEFRFDNGGGPAVIRSLEQITRNKIHRVVARRSSKEGILRLDDGLEAVGMSPGSLASLNLGTDVFLGYVPTVTDEIKKNIGTDIGLVGCIESLTLEGTDTRKEYDLIYPSSEDIVSGMGISECAEGRPCSELPCLNGGSCMVVDGDKYECKCTDGFSGALCQFIDGSALDGAVLPCQPNPCYNGGSCRTLANGDYFCSCMDGFSGPMCDIDKDLGTPVPEFLGDSYLQLPIRDSVVEDLIYEVSFLSKKPDGVLLYSENRKDGAVSDFFSLNLVNQYLQFRFDLGTGPSNITSKTKVPLNVYHKVQIRRSKKEGEMVINDEERVQGDSKGATQMLNLPPVVYVGGFNGEYHRESGCTTGLQGQIQRVYENGIQIEDLLKDALKRHNVWRYQGPPCARDFCMNGGTCIPILNQATCKCEDGFVGNKCEKKASEVNMGLPLKFDGFAYQKYLNRVSTKEKGQKLNEFVIQFKTTASSGLLLLQHKSIDVAGDYIALGLRDGKVEASFNLGKEEKEDLIFLKSDVAVNDGEWHDVRFLREKRSAELQVDNADVQKAVSTTGATQLDTDGNLWLGGARHVLLGLPLEYAKGFDGCVAALTVNGDPVDFIQDRENHGSIEFCES